MPGNAQRAAQKSLTDPKYLAGLLLLSGVYFLGAALGLFLEAEYGGVTPIWPPSGLAVAVLLVRGWRYWPIVVIGEFCVALYLQQPPLAGLVGGLAQLIEVTLVVRLLTPRAALGITRSGRSVLWFAALGVLLPPLVSAAIGSSMLYGLGFLDRAEVLSGFMTWWLGDAIGILVLAPFLVGLKSWPFRSRAAFWACFSYVLALAVICLAIILFSNEKSYYLLFVLIPFVVVASVHFGLVGAGSTTLLLTVIVFGMRPGDVASSDFITTIRMAFVGTCAFTGYLVAGLMTSRRQHLDVIRRQNSYLESLHELVLGLISRLNIDQLLDAIVTQACALLDTPDGCFLQTEEETGTIVLTVGKGLYADVPGYHVESGYGVAGTILRDGEPLVINDYQAWSGRHPDPLWNRVSAMIGVPIRVDDEIVGVLGIVRSGKKEQFQADDLQILQRFGELASIALKNALLYRELSDQLEARDRAENALADSERTHREIFNSTREAICVLDEETGVILQANRAAGEIIGAGEESNGAAFFDLVTGDASPFAEADGIALLQRCLSEGAQVCEWRAVDDEGTVTWLEITFKQALIDNVSRVLAVVRNIDDRKAAEASLSRLRTAIEFAGDDVMITDEDGTIVYVNPSFERTTGFASGEALGQTAPILERGRNQNDDTGDLWFTLSAGRVWTGRFRSQHKEGHTILQDTSVAPIRDEKGDNVGYVLVLRDVTEYERIKNQLMQAQKMEALGQLTSGIAHDFNNILAGIIGYTELALDNELDPDHPANECMKQVAAAGSRAADLVRQLLMMSRPSEVEPRSIDAQPIAREVLRLVRASYPPTLQIDLETTASNSFVMAAPTHIHQILMNLVTNAAQAIEDMKGIIAIRLDSRIVTETPAGGTDGVRPGEYLEIAVADTGSGMDQAVADRIFEPYFTTKDPGKGTGLGMSVVHGIVRQLNGALHVESEVGEGTTVCVLLPTVAVAKGQAESDEQALAGGDESILFVDDNPLLTDIASRFLGSLGYDVSVYESSRIALENFLKDPGAYDLVVTDLWMPGLTGIDLARSIRVMRQDIPIVICTGNPDNIGDEDIAEIGIHDVAAKPLNLNAFASRVRSALDTA